LRKRRIESKEELTLSGADEVHCFNDVIGYRREVQRLLPTVKVTEPLLLPCQFPHDTVDPSTFCPIEYWTISIDYIDIKK